MKKYVITMFILIWPISVWALDEREGYSAVFDINQPQMTIFTVPEGKRFVLLQLNGEPTEALFIALKVNDRMIVDAKTLFHSGYNYSDLRYNHDFPDRCVIVNAGEILTVIHGSYEWDPYPIKFQIVGYFYNVACVSPPVGDLNGDCKVDFNDFAVLASEWLKDGNENSVLSGCSIFFAQPTTLLFLVFCAATLRKRRKEF